VTARPLLQSFSATAREARSEARRASRDAILATHSFIRQLTEGEGRLASALAATDQGLWDLHMPSGDLLCSPRWATMLGYAPNESPKRLDGWLALVRPDERATVEYLMEAHLAGLLPTVDIEYRMLGESGEWQWVVTRGRVIEWGADGQPVRMVGTTADVSERKALEADRALLLEETERARNELQLANERLVTQTVELKARSALLEIEKKAHEEAVVRERIARVAADAARERAENANAEKARFLASMSHELRTPLNAIGGYVDLFSLEVYGRITSEQRTALERVGRSSRHLLALINDLLNFAHIETGRVDYHLEKVPIADLVVELEELIAPQLAAAELRYALSFTCAPETLVHADIDKARQVMLNVLTNAVKFTPPGGSVSVSCGVEGQVGWLRVTDTGRGIAADKVHVIFDPFVQVDPHIPSNRGLGLQGVGLGLAISRELARGMGGELTVVSELGAGSTFMFSLRRPALDEAPAIDAGSNVRT